MYYFSPKYYCILFSTKLSPIKTVVMWTCTGISNNNTLIACRLSYEDLLSLDKVIAYLHNRHKIVMTIIQYYSFSLHKVVLLILKFSLHMSEITELLSSLALSRITNWTITEHLLGKVWDVCTLHS